MSIHEKLKQLKDKEIVIARLLQPSFEQEHKFIDPIDLFKRERHAMRFIYIAKESKLSLLDTSDIIASFIDHLNHPDTYHPRVFNDESSDTSIIQKFEQQIKNNPIVNSFIKLIRCYQHFVMAYDVSLNNPFVRYPQGILYHDLLKICKDIVIIPEEFDIMRETPAPIQVDPRDAEILADLEIFEDLESDDDISSSTGIQQSQIIRDREMARQLQYNINLPLYGAEQSPLNVNNQIQNRITQRSRHQSPRPSVSVSFTSTASSLIPKNLKGTKSEPKKIICFACLTNEPNYIGIPCGHTLTCHDCHSGWLNVNKNNLKCPICKGEVSKCIRLHLNEDDTK